jgi:ribonuclease Z
MERLTILGSAYAIPNPNQDNSHLLVQTSNRVLLIDCGNHPVVKLDRAGVSINSITDLVITHFHSDHVGSLPLLLMDMWLEKRKDVLRIYGLEFTLERIQRLLELFDWQKWAERFPVEFIQLSDSNESWLMNDDTIRITSLPMKHLVPSVGLRMEFPARQFTAVYTSDTEPVENVVRLARGADVLIHEAAGDSRGHTSPAKAGEAAAAAGVKHLVLIHYDPAIPEEEQISAAARGFSGKIDMARDWMVLLD